VITATSFTLNTIALFLVACLPRLHPNTLPQIRLLTLVSCYLVLDALSSLAASDTVLQFAHFALQMSIAHVLIKYKDHGQPQFHRISERQFTGDPHAPQ
jgi:hypothetical protein